MESCHRVQIRQYNDPELLEFFREHHVQYRLVGDHLFIIRSHGRDVAAGPGDWVTTADDEVVVERGDYARRAQRAIESAGRAGAKPSARIRATGSRAAPNRAGQVLGGSTEEIRTEVPESETQRWKIRVEAEARDRLKRKIRNVAGND